MSYSDDHATDDALSTLGEWQAEETPETYRCPSCGEVGRAKVWAWYGYGPADESDPMDDGDVTCGECDGPLCDANIVDGYGCGDCGKALVEPGTDYCAACNAAHDAAEAADPLHHHVWQSGDEFARHVRDLTLLQAVTP